MISFRTSSCPPNLGTTRLSVLQTGDRDLNPGRAAHEAHRANSKCPQRQNVIRPRGEIAATFPFYMVVTTPTWCSCMFHNPLIRQTNGATYSETSRSRPDNAGKREKREHRAHLLNAIPWDGSSGILPRSLHLVFFSGSDDIPNCTRKFSTHRKNATSVKKSSSTSSTKRCAPKGAQL